MIAASVKEETRLSTYCSQGADINEKSECSVNYG